jgi:hypothetical protein
MASVGVEAPPADYLRKEPVDWAEMARAGVAVPETTEDVERLATEIKHHKRNFWIVVLTARRKQLIPSVSPMAVREIVGPNVPVVFLRSLLATYLQTLLPHKLQVYGGAVRVYRPGVYDDPLANPLLYDPSGEYGDKILRRLGRIFTPSRARPPDLSLGEQVLVLEHDLDRARRARRRETKILRRRYAQALLVQSQSQRPLWLPFRRRTERTLIEVELRALIGEQWRSYLPTSDQRKHPLREYKLSSRFLADVHRRIGDAPLDEIARVCALVLCRFDVRDIGLLTGPMRPAPREPQFTRGEGSKAWWCSLTRDGPERSSCLVWWGNTDGTAELVAFGRLQETSL